jgi:hypothetical protein
MNAHTFTHDFELSHTKFTNAGYTTIHSYFQKKVEGTIKKRNTVKKQGRARRPGVMVWKQGRMGKQEGELGGQELNTRMSCPNIEVGAYSTDVQVARPHKPANVLRYV